MEWISGIALQLVFFSFGRLIMHLHRDQPMNESFIFDKLHTNRIVLQLLSDPVQKNKGYKCTARICWLIKNKRVYFEDEKVLLYFNKNQYLEACGNGSWILTDKPLRPIENFKSFNFDYEKYCRLKHIHSQLFLNGNDFSILDKKNAHQNLPLLAAVRKKIVLVIKKYVREKSENGLLEALLVGYTDDLDPLLLKSYADSGVVHIIAISGLHLAFICQILQLALKKFGKKKSGHWVKLFIILFLLWSYSLLSGASPSVIRAAAMFTLVLFARNICRDAVLFNTLSASAFLLLCFDPFWIFDTGFQLSYAAVLSLGLFSKSIRSLIPLKNKLLAITWDAASVSIAAQILTTPISIYYFHRFPCYFLIANLLAVPLSSIILAGGIFLCVCATFPPAAGLIGYLLGFLVRFMNGFISYISSLPGAVLGNLDYNLLAVILLYFIIFCFYRYMARKEKAWLFTALAGVSLFQFIRLIQ